MCSTTKANNHIKWSYIAELADHIVSHQCEPFFLFLHWLSAQWISLKSSFFFFSYQPKSTKSVEKKALHSLLRLQPCRHSNTHCVKWIDVLAQPVLPKRPWPQRQPAWIGILCWRDWTRYIWATLSALFLLLLSFYSLIVHVLIYNNQALSVRWCTLTPAGLASRNGARWLRRTVHGRVWCNWGWTQYFTRGESHEERSSKWPDTQNTFTAPIKHSNGEKITPSMIWEEYK